MEGVGGMEGQLEVRVVVAMVVVVRVSMGMRAAPAAAEIRPRRRQPENPRSIRAEFCPPEEGRDAKAHR